MDGNRRFARKQLREVIAGHLSGEKALTDVRNPVDPSQTLQKFVQRRGTFPPTTSLVSNAFQ
jgi:dsRNA-specific ribonuclease